MAGEPWWVVQGEPDTCAPSSVATIAGIQGELWWEYSAGFAVQEIKLFGAGGRGTMIDFVPLETQKLLDLYASTELTAVSNDTRDTMMPSWGCTDIVETATTLGGLPATSLDCTIDGYATDRVYVVVLAGPRILDDGTSISGFLVEAFNEAEWVYLSEDVFSRLENTLVWK